MQKSQKHALLVALITVLAFAGVARAQNQPTAPAIISVLNAASFVSADNGISPGEIISIFGTNLGPTDALGLQLDAMGNVASLVGGVQVLFVDPYNPYPNAYGYGTIAAPLTYVSATQINCVAPYEIQPETPYYIEVNYLGQASSDVFAFYPTTTGLGANNTGIFTATGTGTGQAAALNSDNTPNTTSNPAPVGSVVQVWMTGEGQTSPPGTTGSVTCSAGCATTGQIPKPLLPVTATVGGQPAAVSFYGEAPGLVAGVMQVNLVIPPNTLSGAVSLSIWVGSSTQAGITIAVK